MDSSDSNDFVGEKKKVSVLGRYDYELFLNVANLFQMIEFFIAVSLIFWSSSRFYSVLKLSGENLLCCSSNVLNQHVVFLLGNVIIGVCYLLSRRTVEGSKSEKEEEKHTYSIQEEAEVTSETFDEEKPDQEGHSENALVETESDQPAIKREEPTGEENRNEEGNNEKAIVKSESETALETAIKQAVKQIERFRRTQSEKLKREMSIKPHRELQRSATERSSLLVTSSSETVEMLSNEEFRLAVETFIAKQQSLIMAETATAL